MYCKTLKDMVPNGAYLHIQIYDEDDTQIGYSEIILTNPRRAIIKQIKVTVDCKGISKTISKMILNEIPSDYIVTIDTR